MHSSAVVLKGVYLNWKEANEACQLIKFSQVKTEYKKFVNQMVKETTVTPSSGYWIQDAVTEFSVVNKGTRNTNKLMIYIPNNATLGRLYMVNKVATRSPLNFKIRLTIDLRSIFSYRI